MANRGNAKLEMSDFDGCIEDCDAAIKIDPKYVKSYFRKSKALHFLTRIDEAMEVVKVG